MTTTPTLSESWPVVRQTWSVLNAVVCLEDPATIAGDLELPGFVLDLRGIWNADL
ncbi:MAG TPA: hypothetical protein VNN62_27575 [Methylomirabilota bacterium]|jgi:hypothetical protein|nr:hypothetical protein [Methylomirabilota bacterium]